MLLLIGANAVLGSLISLFLGLYHYGDFALSTVVFGYFMGAAVPIFACYLPLDKFIFPSHQEES